MSKARQLLFVLVLAAFGAGAATETLSPPTGLTARGVSPARVVLRWKNGENATNGVEIQFSVNEEDWQTAKRTDPGVTSSSIFLTVPAASYAFRARVFRAADGAVGDWSETVYGKTLATGDIPSDIDHSALSAFPPVGEQVGGSCVAWAVGYYAYGFAAADRRGWNAAAGDGKRLVSPQWLHNLTSKVDDKNGIDGSWQFFAAKVLTVHGAMSWADFAEGTKQSDGGWPLEYARWRRALDLRAATSESIDNVTTADGLRALKKVLAAGNCVTLSTFIHQWLAKPADDDPNTNADDALVGQSVAYDRGPGGEPHAMCCVGYNDFIWLDLNANGAVDRDEKGAIKVVNAQGDGWMDNGFCWIPYSRLDIMLKAKTMFYCVPRDDGDGRYRPKLVGELVWRTNARDRLLVVGKRQGGAAPSTDLFFNLPTAGRYCFDGVERRAAFRTAPELFLPVDLSDLAAAVGKTETYDITVALRDDASRTGGHDGALLDSFRILEPSRTTNYLDGPMSARDNRPATFSFTYSYPVAPPRAIINAFAGRARSGAAVAFDCLGSTDNSGLKACRFEWDFGDGKRCSGRGAVAHVYAAEGVYRPTLTVIDPDGFRDTSETVVIIDDTPPVPVAVEAVGDGLLKVRFSEPPDTSDIAERGVFSVNGGATVASAEPCAEQADAVLLRVDNAVRKKRYVLKIAPFSDRTGNVAAKPTELSFVYSPPKAPAATPRDAFTPSAATALPQIVVSENALTFEEGAGARLKIKLSAVPETSKTIHVQVLAPKNNVRVRGTEDLYFNAENWDAYQGVSLISAKDEDLEGSRATVRCSGYGVDSVDVPITLLDNDAAEPPKPLEAKAVSAIYATLRFDRTLDRTTATNPRHYSVDKNVVVENAVLSADGESVLLTLSPLKDGAYRLSIRGVKGENGAPARDTTVLISYSSLPPGLLTRLRFDEGENTGVALDSSGNGYQGNVGMDVQANRPGKLGKAVAFDGKEADLPRPYAVVTISDLPRNASFEDVTVAFWYKCRPGKSGCLFAWGDRSDGDNYMNAFLDVKRGLSIKARDFNDTESSGACMVQPTGFADGQWRHLAIVKSAVGVKVYFDGQPQLDDGLAMGEDPFVPAKGVVIGGDDDYARRVEASIDDFRIYNAALTPEQILGLYLTDDTTTPRRAVVHDFNGDGNSDVLYRRATDGLTAIDFMDGSDQPKRLAVLDPGSTAWAIAGEADFNGDGKMELIERDANSGKLLICALEGHRGFARYALAPDSSDWKPTAAGDLNGDGRDDLVLQQDNNPAVYAYLMDGPLVLTGGQVIAGDVPEWSLRAVGDLDGDGKADFLFRHAKSGALFAFVMDGLTIREKGFVWRGGDARWEFAALADLDGDRAKDIVLRNSESGAFYAFLAKASSEDAGVICESKLAWTLGGVGDFNGDNRDDLLLYDPTNSSAFLVLMNGTRAIAADFTWSRPAAGWALGTIGDFNGDGTSDLLINNGSGLGCFYLHNGLEVIGYGYLPALAPEWKIH